MKGHVLHIPPALDRITQVRAHTSDITPNCSWWRIWTTFSRAAAGRTDRDGSSTWTIVCTRM